MTQNNTMSDMKSSMIIAELIDDITLTLEDFSQACAVEPAWVVERVEAGILGGKTQGQVTFCFVSADLMRARQLVAIERDFDANQELAALVADLIEEVRRLKAHLKAVGVGAN